MKRIGILTSGGDSPGMNAAIRSVVRCGIEAGFEVYGIYRGYEGLLDGDIKELDRSSVGDVLHRGGTILKTARSEKFRTDEGQRHAVNMLETFGTIDNDLGYTDYTIGFDTAVTTVLDAIGKIRDTSSSHERTTVVEVMGRHCGDIALYSGLAGGAEAVLIPEIETDFNELCRKIVMGANRGKQHSIIIKAEGVGISSQQLTEMIEERTGRETRLVVLSYLQRGGSPTMRDRLLATLAGAKAVELLRADSESKAIGTVEGKIVAYDLEEALKQKREIDADLFDLIGILGK